MQTASKTLMETLTEVYEGNWVGHDLMFVQAQNQEMLWADLAHKLSDQVTNGVDLSRLAYFWWFVYEFRLFKNWGRNPINKPRIV